MNQKFIVYLVSFAAFLGPFTQTIYTPILPEVTKDFHTLHFLINLTISIFTLFLALMQMVYGVFLGCAFVLSRRFLGKGVSHPLP